MLQSLVAGAVSLLIKEEQDACPLFFLSSYYFALVKVSVNKKLLKHYVRAVNDNMKLHSSETS